MFRIYFSLVAIGMFSSSLALALTCKDLTLNSPAVRKQAHKKLDIKFIVELEPAVPRKKQYSGFIRSRLSKKETDFLRSKGMTINFIAGEISTFRGSLCNVLQATALPSVTSVSMGDELTSH
jgi:hypothetical protein